MSEAAQRYLLALGGNVRHPRYGNPRKVVAAAIEELDKGKIAVLTSSRIVTSAPLGPSRREYANAVVLIETGLDPRAMLARAQKLERRFGRRRRGARWSARSLDCDIVLWSGGMWCDDALTIPHPAFRQRNFVLGPASAVAPGWRDPVTDLTLRHLHHRLRRQGA